MINLDSVLKSKDITLLTKVHLVKAMVFPVIVYGCESWTIKKADHWRIDAFELWYCRRLLRFPWTARRSNQSVLKEINPEYVVMYGCESWTESGWTPGVRDGQRGLACCDSWGCKELDTTERLNWTEDQIKIIDLKIIKYFKTKYCWSEFLRNPMQLTLKQNF